MVWLIKCYELFVSIILEMLITYHKHVKGTQKRCFYNIKLLITSDFRWITLCIKTFVFLLTNVCFPTKLDHIKYEVLWILIKQSKRDKEPKGELFRRVYREND